MTIDWRAAVHEGPSSVLLDLEVVPGSDRAEFPSGHNAWRGRIQARLSQPPVDGRANQELVRLVADFFAVRPADVELAAGATSRQKQVRIASITKTKALERLAERLDGS